MCYGTGRVRPKKPLNHSYVSPIMPLFFLAFRPFRGYNGRNSQFREEWADCLRIFCVSPVSGLTLIIPGTRGG